MTDLFRKALFAPIESPILLVLSIAYFLVEAIRIYDARLLQADMGKYTSGVSCRAGDRLLPSWLGYLHVLGWVLFIAILLLNWLYAILLYAFLFLLRVLPVLENIGELLMRPFLGREQVKGERQKLNSAVVEGVNSGPPNFGGDPGDKPLISAYAGSMDFIVPFLREGASPSYFNDDGDTLLHAAADGWQYRMVEFLIQSGANVDAQNRWGNTPLHMVTLRREIPYDGTFLINVDAEVARNETFRVLLRHGADRKIKSSQGDNPLHLAASGGDLIAIRELLSLRAGDFIDEVTNKGATALALAVLNEHIECVECLIASGADPRLEISTGVTILDLLHSIENAELKRIYNSLTKQS